MPSGQLLRRFESVTVNSPKWSRFRKVTVTSVSEHDAVNDHESEDSGSNDGTGEFRSAAELTVGQEIEAWHGGQLAHRGKVSNTLRSMNLFWVYDAAAGTGRLLDTEEFSIRPVQRQAEFSLNAGRDLPGQ
ncbi:MAG: hypothetical protein NVS3B6_08570 [Pseudarthrobacter sp.]